MTFTQSVAANTKQYSSNIYLNSVTTHNVSIKDVATKAEADTYKAKASTALNSAYDPIQNVFVAVFGSKQEQMKFAAAVK